jgi:hypothetical protein
MDLPKILIPVLADIIHQSETGKHRWYEIVYHDGKKWCHYAGCNTFDDGESVKQWKYAEECLSKDSVPLGCEVMQAQVSSGVQTAGLWTDIKDLRADIGGRFNGMPIEQRGIGAESSTIDCIRDLLMIKDNIDKLIDARLKAHVAYLESKR